MQIRQTKQRDTNCLLDTQQIHRTSGKYDNWNRSDAQQLMPSLRVTRQLMPSLRDTRQQMPSLQIHDS